MVDPIWETQFLDYWKHDKLAYLFYKAHALKSKLFRIYLNVEHVRAPNLTYVKV